MKVAKYIFCSFNILSILFSCSSSNNKEENTTKSTGINNIGLQEAIMQNVDSNYQTKNKYEVLTHRVLGKTHIYFVLVSDANEYEMNKITEELVANDLFAFVHFYLDKSKLSDSRYSNDIYDVLPESGYIAKYEKKRRGIHAWKN